MSEKLQKVLARQGMGSRRQLEQWIKDGRVKVNGKVAELGVRVEATDKINVDGIPIELPTAKQSQTRILLYHKPEGEISTVSDPEGRRTVFDKLPILKNQRWVSVGRLDIRTSGLLLFTNDGELANYLMHPSSELERVYAVRVRGKVSEGTIMLLLKGVMLDDGKAKFDAIMDAGGSGGHNHWYHVSLHEGRNREVRRLWESQDVTVSRLIRIQYGPIALERSLRKGTTYELKPQQVSEFVKNVGFTKKKKSKGGESE